VAEEAKRIKVTRTRGEDVQAGQDVLLEDKQVWRVLRQERGYGGGGAVLVHRKERGKMWRGYENWDNFNVVKRGN
tara:strand:- start:1997 stop:2221 length:225 start_codon:yes stop_codon:yes gene_type:complete